MIKGHTLVLGISEGGKTTVCERIAKQFRAKGFQVLFLATMVKDFPADFFYTNATEFVNAAKKMKRCLLVVDDAADNLEKYDSELQWLGSQSRHWGHAFLINSQRYFDLSPRIRNNAKYAIVFRMSKSDSKMIAEDFVDEKLLKAHSLKRFHFLIGGKYEEFRETKLAL